MTSNSFRENDIFKNLSDEEFVSVIKRADPIYEGLTDEQVMTLANEFTPDVLLEGGFNSAINVLSQDNKPEGFFGDMKNAVLRSVDTFQQASDLAEYKAGIDGADKTSQDLMANQYEKQLSPMSDSMTESLATIQDKFKDGWGAGLWELAKNPSAIPIIAAESVANFAPGIAAGYVGGVAGTAVMPGYGTAAGVVGGIGAGAYYTEYFNSVLQSLNEAGANSPEEFQAMLENDTFMQEAYKDANERGIPIAIAEAVTAGLAGKVYKGAKTLGNTSYKTAVEEAVQAKKPLTDLAYDASKKRIGAGILGEAMLQSTGGATGEALAILNDKGEITADDRFDIAIEGVAEMPGSLVDVPLKLRAEAKALKLRQKRELQAVDKGLAAAEEKAANGDELDVAEFEAVKQKADIDRAAILQRHTKEASDLQAQIDALTGVSGGGLQSTRFPNLEGIVNQEIINESVNNGDALDVQSQINQRTNQQNPELEALNQKYKKSQKYGNRPAYQNSNPNLVADQFGLPNYAPIPPKPLQIGTDRIGYDDMQGQAGRDYANNQQEFYGSVDNEAGLPRIEKQAADAKRLMPANFNDGRLGNEDYRFELEKMDRELVAGRSSLIPSNEIGVQFKGRTSSNNPSWFKDGAFSYETKNGTQGQVKSVTELKNIIGKILTPGANLSEREKSIATSLLNVASGGVEDFNADAQGQVDEQAQLQETINAYFATPPVNPRGESFVPTVTQVDTAIKKSETGKVLSRSEQSIIESMQSVTAWKQDKADGKFNTQSFTQPKANMPTGNLPVQEVQPVNNNEQVQDVGNATQKPVIETNQEATVKQRLMSAIELDKETISSKGRNGVTPEVLIERAENYLNGSLPAFMVATDKDVAPSLWQEVDRINGAKPIEPVNTADKSSNGFEQAKQDVISNEDPNIVAQWAFENLEEGDKILLDNGTDGYYLVESIVVSRGSGKRKIYIQKYDEDGEATGAGGSYMLSDNADGKVDSRDAKKAWGMFNDYTATDLNGNRIKLKTSLQKKTNSSKSPVEPVNTTAKPVENVQDNVQVAQSGKPFKSEKTARMSKTFKSLANGEVVPVDGGFGVREAQGTKLGLSGTKSKMAQAKGESDKPLFSRKENIEGRRLKGAPNVDGGGQIPEIFKAAQNYARDNGINLQEQSEYVSVDKGRAERIAKAYEEMENKPDDPIVKEAYENLSRQVIEQYKYLQDAGYKFYFFDSENDPYNGNPWEAIRDLRENKRMGVYMTEDGFGSDDNFDSSKNPLLNDTGMEWGYGSVNGEKKRVLVNDLFRAVHDAFGHGMEGSGFRAEGEENAWQAHVRLFKGSAVGALTSETRGQNSWLNFGKYGSKNKNAKVDETVFADQKIGLMPEWVWTEGRLDAYENGQIVYGESGRVSTRQPTNPKEELSAKTTDVSIDSMGDAQISKALSEMATHASLRVNLEKGSDKANINKIVKQLKDNLVWLHGQLDSATIDSTKQWYDGANKLAKMFAERYGVSDKTSAAVLAALSPQTDWNVNVSQAERVMDIYTTKQDEVFNDEMAEYASDLGIKQSHIDLMFGKSLSEIMSLKDLYSAEFIRVYDELYYDRSYKLVLPEGRFGDKALNAKGQPKNTAWGSYERIANAISAIHDDSNANISKVLGNGHKVRSFYNNILAPYSQSGDVTIDTHAVAAAELMPYAASDSEVTYNFGGVSHALSGNKGSYPIYAEAYRQAAKEVGLLPREMQSVTWEAIRELYTASFKQSDKNKQKVRDIWLKYKNGNQSLDATRKEILSIGGKLGAKNANNTIRQSSDRGDGDGFRTSNLGKLYEDQRAAESNWERNERLRAIRKRYSNRTKKFQSEGYRLIRQRLVSSIGDNDGKSSLYIRESEESVRLPTADSNVKGKRLKLRNKEVSTLLEDSGIKPVSFYELDKGVDFFKLLEESKNGSRYGSAVELKDKPEYKKGKMKMFATADGKAGFAVTNDGDIVSVFKSDDTDIQSFASSALVLAIENGGRKLDAFDTVLPKIYGKLGFVETGRVQWDDQYKPDKWDYNLFSDFNNGRPDVVFMELNLDGVSETRAFSRKESNTSNNNQPVEIDPNEQDAIRLLRESINEYQRNENNSYQESDIGLPDNIRTALENLFDRKIIGFKTTAGYDFNGVVLPNDEKTIYVNSEANKPVMAIAGHEFMHGLRKDNPALYQSALEAIGSVVGDTNYDKYVDNFNAKTDANNEARQSEQVIAEELMADILGDNFTRPEFWAKVSQRLDADKSGLFNQLMKSIKAFLKNLQSTLSPLGSNEYLTDVEQAQDIMAEVAALHMKSRMGNKKAQAEMASMAKADPKFMFAGTKAKTADLMRLDKAKEMLDADYSAETARRETGWFKGVDDKWRFEIDDSQAQYEPVYPDLIEIQESMDKAKTGREVEELTNDYNELLDVINPNETAVFPLSRVLKHKALFDAYPALNDVNVTFNKSMRGGEYRHDSSLIVLGMESLGDAKEAKTTLLHEIQHAIQTAENFARGGSPNEFSLKFNEDVSKAKQERAYKVLSDFRERLFKENPRLEELDWQFSNGELADSKIKPFLSELELAEKELLKKDFGLDLKVEAAKRDLANKPKTAYEAYQALAGEVEARNTQTRMTMTDAERLLASPESTEDVARSEQGVRFGGGIMQSINQDNGKGSPAWESAKAKGLDMSQEARLQRARDMGFDTDAVYYHGTNKDFDSFSKDKQGQNFTSMYGKGFYFASTYRHASEHGNVSNYYLKYSNPLKASLSHTKAASDAGLDLQEYAKSLGHDSIVAGDNFMYQVVVFEPNQIRSINAAFDPDQADSPNLMFSRKEAPNQDEGSIESFRSKFGRPDTATSVKQWFSNLTNRLTLRLAQGIFDKYRPLRELDQSVYGENVVKDNTTHSSWVLAKMSEAGQSALSVMMQYGRIKYDTKQKVLQPVEDTKNEGFLNDMAKTLGSSEEIDRFFRWIAANRSSELMKADKEHLFTAKEIEFGLTENEGKLEDGSSRKEAYVKAHEKFKMYHNDVLDIATQAGLVSKESRADWENQFYVPFYRVLDDEAVSGVGVSGGQLKPKEAYKALKGGTQNVNDLLENTLMNWNHLLTNSMRNMASKQAIDNAVLAGVASKMAYNEKSKRKTHVFIDGKKVEYDVSDQLVFDALTMITHSGIKGTSMDLARGFKRVFTNFTTASPQFIVANLIRDSLQAVAVTDGSSYNVAKNVAKGAKQFGTGLGKRMSKERAQIMAAGGSFSFGYVYGRNSDDVKYSIDKQLGKVIRTPSDAKGAFKAIGRGAQAGWDKWQSVNDMTENVNRMSIYDTIKNETGNELYAALQARDLMDFSAHGSYLGVRFLTDVVPFLNARLQGLDKIYRSGVKPSANALRAMFGGKDASATDKQLAMRFAAVTGALTLATLALRADNEDDEDYRKLEDWHKDTYWSFKADGNWYHIPKPFEVGAIATIAERTMEQVISDHPEVNGKLFWGRIKDMAMGTFSFDPTPQIVKPALELWANEDSFTGRPIESMGMDGLSPERRYRDSTSELAKALSSAGSFMGEANISPVQYDHLIKGYLGWVGATANGHISTVVNMAEGKESPEKAWYEYQPARRFFTDLDKPTYTKYGTMFYESLRESNRIYKDIVAMRKEGLDYQEFLEDNRDKIKYRKFLNRTQKSISTINNRMKMIRNSNKPADVKRQELDLLQVRKNNLQEMAVKRYIGD